MRLALVEAWGFTRGDVLLHALPIYHVHGLFVAIHCVLLSGARMLWLPKFDAQEVIERLPGATVMMGVPTFYTRLLAQRDFTRDACRSVRLFVSGSAPLLPETFESFRERTGQTILERYGMTETGMIASNPLDGARAAGTVGRPLPGIAVRIVDGNREPCAPGTLGDIEVRGPNVFAGYWRMPEKTREEFTVDGWFRTGDIGEWVSDGKARDYLRLVGRAKDMIISGGLNVYPKEVEERIDALPGVAESAVIGMPDPDFGEAVMAVVVPQGRPRARRGCDHRRAQSGDRGVQGSEARARRARASAQRDGQGAEEPAPRDLRDRAPRHAPVTRGTIRRPKPAIAKCRPERPSCRASPEPGYRRTRRRRRCARSPPRDRAPDRSPPSRAASPRRRGRRS